MRTRKHLEQERSLTLLSSARGFNSGIGPYNYVPSREVGIVFVTLFAISTGELANVYDPEDGSLHPHSCPHCPSRPVPYVVALPNRCILWCVRSGWMERTSVL